MNDLVGLCVSLIVIILFWTLILACLFKAGVKELITNINIFSWISVCIWLLGMSIIIYLIIKENNFVYYWDYGREWGAAVNVSNGLFVNTKATLNNIYSTINTLDYNQLMPILIAAPLHIFGNTFVCYVMINQIFYMIPAIIIISILIYKIIWKVTDSKPKFTFIVFIVSMTQILYYVELDGFMDPPVLIMISTILLMAFEWDFSKLDIPKCLMISILLLTLVICRRHFAYWVVGFITSQFVSLLLQLQNDKNNRKNLLLGYLKSMLTIGIICLSVLLIFFRGFFVQSVFNNFSIAYKAYDVTLKQKLERVIVVFGWGIILFIVFAIAVSCIKKNRRSISIIVIYLTNIMVATLLLWRVLQMNFHQYYLIVIQILALFVLAVHLLINATQNQFIKKIIIIVVICICVLNMSTTFIPATRNIPCKKLFSNNYYGVKYRDDMEQIYCIIDDLEELCEDDINKKIYVLSSSGVLNSHTLSYSLMPDKERALPQLLDTYNIDLRDGFPSPFINADILVVGNPVQIHCPAETQRIITYLSELIMDSNSYLGRHYTLYKKYNLTEGTEALIYTRNSLLTKEDYSTLQEYYNQYYSDYPQLFNDRLQYEKAFFPEKKGESIVLNADCTELVGDFNEFISTGQGCLVYGPRKKLQEGTYNVEFIIDYEGDLGEDSKIGWVDIYINDQVIIGQEYYVKDTKIILNNCVLPESENAEFRIYALSAGVKFKQIVVTRIE